MRRQVNNIARLPREMQLKIASLLLCDGYTYDQIRDEMVLLGVELPIHNSSLLAFQKSEVFNQFNQSLLIWQNKTLKKAIEHQVVSDSPVGSAQEEYELMTQIKGLISTVESPKDIRALTAALKDLSSIKESRKIQAIEKQLEEMRITHETELLAKTTEINRLNALLSKDSAKGLSKSALEEIERKAGLL